MLLNKPVYKRLAVLARRSRNLPLVEVLWSILYLMHFVDAQDIVCVYVELISHLLEHFFLTERM